jgi:hypothetical protein
MKSRLASFLLASALISAPAFAQGPPGGVPGGSGSGAIQSLANDLAALTARVAKLEGDIVAADLAGTYALLGINTSISALRPGLPGQPPVANAEISLEAFRGKLTLTADGNGHLSDVSGEFTTLTQGLWTVTGGSDTNGTGATDVKWTYADGVITITFLDDGDEVPFTVGIGGRFFVMSFAPFHPGDASGQQFLVMATRLK